ncbi:hypothetical protein ACHAXR_011642 [Thalassiosira sp. AJA248-18]
MTGRRRPTTTYVDARNIDALSTSNQRNTRPINRRPPPQFRRHIHRNSQLLIAQLSLFSMPPSGSLANIIRSSSPAAAANLVSSSAWTLRRFIISTSTVFLRPLSVLSTISSSSASTTTLFSTNNIMTASNTIAFANPSPSAIAGPPSSEGSGRAPTKNGNILNKIASWRPSARTFSFSNARKRTFSISSVPSFISSSSSQSDDCSDVVAGQQQSRHFSNTSSRGNDNNNGSIGGSKLSSNRAQAAIKLLPSYLIDARAITQYSPATPEGALQLSVAENQLSELPVGGLVGIEESTQAGGIATVGKKDMRLVDVLSQLASSNIARPSDDGARAMHVFERDMVYYQPTQGVPGLRQGMADYLQSLLLPSSSVKFNPENIILGAGCNAVLENLCMVIANPGDAVLIPTPYYAAFEFDLVARAGCHIVPVNTFNHHDDDVPSCRVPIPPEFYYPNRSSLDRAYDRAAEETGRAPRVLLLSHPNNPLGICYPPHVVQECIDWCREKEVHLISDEIYAGSVYRKERNDGGGETFVSAMALGSTTSNSDGLGLGPYIHLVYALSKDFALSGLRVGVAYTENEEILLPIQKLNDLCQISSQTQLLVERMVTANAVMENDDNKSQKKFVDVYLKSNQDNVRDRCDTLQSCLDELKIPYLNADSGLFVWMDFREFLPSLPSDTTEAMDSLESKEQRERKLYLSLMKEYGLLFTPGMSMRNERAGFFRCVFTAASGDEFELGLVRLRKFVEEMRR